MSRNIELMAWAAVAVVFGALVAPVGARYWQAAFINPDTSGAGLVLVVALVWGASIIRRFAGRDGPGDGAREPATGVAGAAIDGGRVGAMALAGSVVLIVGHAIEVFTLCVLGLWILVQVCLECAIDGPLRRRLRPVRRFSLLAVPIPQSFVVAMTGGIKERVASGCGSLLEALGLPLAVSGNRILTAHGVVEVAPACSGFRSLVVLVTLSLGIALHRNLGLGRLALLALAAAMAATVTNIVRVVGVVCLAHWGAVTLPDTWHSILGLLLDIVALYFIVLLGTLLRPALDRPGAALGSLT